MLSVSLGPLGLSVDRLLIAVAFLLSLAVGWLVARRRGLSGSAGVGGALTDMFLAGFVAARVVFVLQWFDVYRAQPWSMLDIRDGGFNFWAGLAVALLVGVWRLLRRPTLRVPLASGVLAGLLLWGGVSGALQLLSQQAPGVPATQLQTLSGAPVLLADLGAGRPLVVNLWATWCAPCVREMPVLEDAQATHRGVAFVFVNQGAPAARVQGFLEAQGLSLDNVLLDPSGALANDVGSRAMPTTLFYDAQGRLRDTYLGALSEASLAARLSRLGGVQ